MAKKELTSILVMSAGAGMGSAVAGLVKNVMPGISEDIAQILVGGAIYYLGGKKSELIKKFGAGVLIAGLGNMIKGFVPSLGISLGANAKTANVTACSTVEQVAVLEASR